MVDTSFFNCAGPFTVKKLAEIGHCKLSDGSKSDLLINSVAPIDIAKEGEITFLSNPKYAEMLANSKASACIILEKHLTKAPENIIVLISANPYASYAKIATFLHPQDKISVSSGIDKSASIKSHELVSPSANIGPMAKIGKNTYIGDNVYIGRGVKIGDNCYIKHDCTITHSVIGNDVIIHPGVRIGQDGFGYATEQGVHIKVPQLGRVVIQNDVEIGANTCIDRGAGPDTFIGMGTKIDNLVQIGHNVKIGKGCIIVSQVGIAGSTVLGDYVVLGGQVGVAGHLNIGNMVNVAAQSGIGQDVPAKQILGGYPAIPIKQWHRQTIALKKLVIKGNKKGDQTNE